MTHGLLSTEMLRARVELARLFGTGISNLRVCRFHHLSVVLEAGLEPARPSVGHRVLSPARLPCFRHSSVCRRRESNPRPELCKSPALSTELRRLSSCARESNPLERPYESRPRPPSTHGMVPPRFELGSGPTGSRTQMKSRAKRPCAPAPGPVSPAGVEPSASRASGERSSVELREQRARGQGICPQCPRATLLHPLTHITCRSSATTSTSSDWLAITVSMSL